MNIIIKIFDAADTHAIHAEEGRLNGLGYEVTRLNGGQGVDLAVEALDPAVHRHFDHAVVLIAAA